MPCFLLYSCYSRSSLSEACRNMAAQARHLALESGGPLLPGRAILVPTAALRARILLVEDELVQADQMRDAIRARGLEVVGPVGNLEAAIELATSETLHGALLDIRLQRGLRIFPVVEILWRRRIPFCFLTAFGEDRISAMPAAAVFHKPVSLGALHSAISILLEA
ncbi:response regulator [Mycobacterium sp. KBS0706]|nr:response regulator [Mycobacterium sp. KBS0706]